MPRSLTIPPGIPDFFTRERFLDAGPCLLEGRAWSGWGADRARRAERRRRRHLDDAELGEPPGERAWRGWSYAWDAPAPGSHVICSRATDAAGNVQPVEPPWNLKGFANNEVERLRVTVRPLTATRASSPKRVARCEWPRTATRHLAIYLNDHLAGSTTAIELVRRAVGQYEGTPLGEFFAELGAEIEQDRDALKAVMAANGVEPQRSSSPPHGRPRRPRG